MKYPDARKHFYISIAKSGIRIFAGIMLAVSAFVIHDIAIVTSGAAFVLAEILGIAEEIV
jgi:hypothetical protein